MENKVIVGRRHAPPLYNVDPLVTRIYGPEHRLELISRSAYVVVAAPLTAETRGMIGEPEFDAMKPEAVVINLGRGPVIHEAAMDHALSEHRIKGAALDVFDQAPLPDRHPLHQQENELHSPH